jgi:hypothetical protein
MPKEGKSQGADKSGLLKVQAEALPPAERTALIREALEDILDMASIHGSKKQSESDRAEILARLNELLEGARVSPLRRRVGGVETAARLPAGAQLQQGQRGLGRSEDAPGGAR